MTEVDRYEARLVAITIVEHALAGRDNLAQDLIDDTGGTTVLTGLIHVAVALTEHLKYATDSTPEEIFAHLRGTAHQGIT